MSKKRRPCRRIKKNYTYPINYAIRDHFSIYNMISSILNPSHPSDSSTVARVNSILPPLRTVLERTYQPTKPRLDWNPTIPAESSKPQDKQKDSSDRSSGSPSSSLGSSESNNRKKDSTSNRRICTTPDCTRIARRAGKCHIHGGRKTCKADGCNKCSHKGGYCVGHGGGIRCSVDGCTKSAQKGGKCFRHGGGRRCIVNNCNRAAKVKDKCTSHAIQ